MTGLEHHPDVHAAIAAAGVTEAQRPAYLQGAGRARRSPEPSRRAPPRHGAPVKLVDHFQYGLNSPICLTWELTYACNLACVHCLSSSGRRDPRELTTARGQGRHRRAAADAGLLRQHRRR